MDNILDVDNTPKEISLEDLVGPGKKYASPQELAKAYYNADTHIKTLTQKQDELRADYLKEREENQTRAKLEELIKRLDGVSQPDQSTPVVVESKPFDMTQIDSILSHKV